MADDACAKAEATRAASQHWADCGEPQDGAVNHATIGIIVILAVIGSVTTILLLSDSAHDKAGLRDRCHTIQRHVIPDANELALIAQCEQVQRGQK